MHDFDAIALLHDPGRRQLYEFVVEQGGEVSRNQAAEAVGMPRMLAAFHLDRLAAAGLLAVSYRRLGGRSGPGAGRPAKLYRRCETEHAVTVPPRDYAGAALIFADAIERSGGEVALYDAARERGLAAGRALAAARVAKSDGAGEAVLEELEGILERELAARGYAPYRDGGLLRLRNCPFHALAREFPVVACGMNLVLLEGILGGLRVNREARLAPRPGECCVVIGAPTDAPHTF